MYGLLVIDNGTTTFVDASEDRQALKDFAKALAEKDVLQCQEIEDYVGVSDSLSLTYSIRETENGWDVVGTYRSTMQDKPAPWCKYVIVPAIHHRSIDWSQILSKKINNEY